MSQMLKSR